MKIQTEGKFTVAIFVIAAFVLALGVASAADYYVATTGNDTTGDGSSGNPWRTIQHAVNNATASDIIIVRDGTYTENVLVNVDNLTIRSENGSANCTVTANNPSDYVFHVTKNYVNISGFNVTGATFPFSGIYLDSVNNCTISNNTASGNGHGIELSSSNYNNLINNTANSNSMDGYGINLYYSSYNNLVNNNASNNDIGICLWDSSSNNTLVNNNASHNIYDGIRLYSYCNYNNLTGNNASNNTYIGISLEAFSNFNTLTDNTANSNSGSEDGYGIYLESSSNNNLTDNTASNNLYHGIYLLFSSNYNNLVENTVVSNGNGIVLLGSSDNNLTGNNASNNGNSPSTGNGIRLSSSSSYNNLTKNTANSNTANGISLSTSSSNNTLTGNTVSNNKNGITLSTTSNYNNLTGNTVSYNTGNVFSSGITLSGSSYNTITCNWVHHNTLGFFIVATGASTGNTIESNNIMFNSLYNFYNMQSTTVEAKNNYWGLVNNVTIDASIYDNEESSGSCGAVTFYPFATGPVPCAPGPLLGVTKTVWNGTAWVTEVWDAHLNDTVRFNCTITNIGTVNLSQVRFWDILDCSLVFAGNATLTNATGVVVNDSIVLEGNYTFKPKALHPNNLSWDPYTPSDGEWFTELCPDTGHQRELWGWEDTNNDGRISACDQINLSGFGLLSYHVDRVPYTLTLSNETYGTTYFDSVLDWDDPGMNLSDPLNSTWLEVCCCKDRYTLLEWIDRSGFGLGSGDTVTMQNERTGEMVGYYVENITKDLVVNREFGIDNLLEDTFILEPDQTITLEYNATDIRCGYDENTFVAKGLYDGKWTYSNEDVAVVEVPPRPAVETNLTVWNGTAWAKEVTVLVNETLNFSWLVHNNGTCCDLVNIEGTLSFGSSEITKDDIESLVPCSEANGTLKVPALECGTYTVWWNVSADCSETYETVTAEDTVTVTVACPELEVNKTVWNGTAWVKALDANIGDTLTFNCTIYNTGNVNLSEIRFWDILDCSLNFSGNETLELSGEDVDISLDGTYIFKPRVLHSDNLSWDPHHPLPSVPGPYPEFTELCPNNETWYLEGWEDTNNDTRVSACDQLEFEGAYSWWYHVENVPYTLLVNNKAANTSMYIDSVLDYEAVNLSTPTGTEWLGVCCCKDRYNLTMWYDTNVTGDLNVNDTLVLQNLRTGEVAQYTVEEVAIDLVVSREWELNTLHYPDPVIFEPNQTITIEYNATVISCGVDNNTFRAKGDSDCSAEGEEWIYSNEAKVTITVPCPSGYGSDSGGTEQEVYYTDETVYATGSGFARNSEVDIYITEDKHWIDGTPINSTIYKEKHNVTTDGNGSILGEKIWPNPDPGEYDIVYDTNNNMKFDLGVDAADNENDPGFIVLGREQREQIPALTPLGIAALIGLLSVIAINTIERRKKR